MAISTPLSDISEPGFCIMSSLSWKTGSVRKGIRKGTPGGEHIDRNLIPAGGGCQSGEGVSMTRNPGLIPPEMFAEPRGAESLPDPTVPPAEGDFVFYSGSRFRPNESAFIFFQGGLLPVLPGRIWAGMGTPPFPLPSSGTGRKTLKRRVAPHGKPDETLGVPRTGRIRPVRTERPARQVKMMCPPAEIS
ncbi:MAG: hypothetical protein BWX98_02103 [Candidatus Aminicenantes bacterium ADurb.Bin147]|nr:MAG: hypothetical protein BWX98_02103 [Candidatus Aminicenantes bacterium ADurb.Bin147]